MDQTKDDVRRVKRNAHLHRVAASVERMGLGEELGVVVEPSVTSILSRVGIQLDFVSDQKAEVKVQKKNKKINK